MQQLAGALGTTYQPEADLVVTTQNGVLWGEQELRKVNEAQTLLSALVQESKIKVTSLTVTPQSPTLEAAINQLNQGELAQKQRDIVDKTTDAKGEAADIEATAAAQRILEEARLTATNILREAMQKRPRTNAKNWWTKPIIRSRTRRHRSKLSVNWMKRVTSSCARRLRIRSTSQTGPFLTPGYWTPTSMSYDKKPWSLTQLQGNGALDENPEGLRKLGLLAANSRDKVRPA